ncbi:MAG: sigma-70 family RNA polymerase sigma factor [Longimicrobiales bacterium]
MQSDVTRLLRSHAAGDRAAFSELLPLVYEELRAIAGKRLSGERPDHTLGATALVHESWMKLVRLDHLDWSNRAHFFAIAARAMRQVLLDHAIARNAQKRGGGVAPVTLDNIEIGREVPIVELIALEQALRKLESLDERQLRVVECRCFGGMSIEETAEALGVSTATVSRDWTFARAWLARELSSDAGPPDA